MPAVGASALASPAFLTLAGFEGIEHPAEHAVSVLEKQSNSGGEGTVEEPRRAGPVERVRDQGSATCGRFDGSFVSPQREEWGLRFFDEAASVVEGGEPEWIRAERNTTGSEHLQSEHLTRPAIAQVHVIPAAQGEPRGHLPIDAVERDDLVPQPAGLDRERGADHDQRVWPFSHIGPR